MRVAVVGAGIMGLSTAWALARSGATVTVLDQGSIPNPLGSSCDRHRLIRYPYGASAGYARRVEEAYRAWDILWKDLGQSYYRPTGTLALEGAKAGWTTDSRDTLDHLGVPHSVLSRHEVSRRFPYLRCDDVEWALYLESGGALLAQGILTALRQDLDSRGVTLRSQTQVVDLDPASPSLRLGTGERLEADRIVVAAGPWTGELVTQPPLPVQPSRQVVVYIEPPPALRDTWRHAPMILDVGSASGFYSVPDVDGHGPKIGDHTFSLTGAPSQERDPTDAEGQAVFQLCANRLVDFERYRLREARSCFYTVHADERFIIQERDKAWILAGFSGHGFKFGAAMGLATADVILGHRDPEGLALWAAGDEQQPARIPPPDSTN